MFYCQPISGHDIAAQQTNVDSLINVLDTHTTLTPAEQMILCDEISRALTKGYAHEDLRKAVLYAEKGLETAEKEKKKNKTMISNFYERIGISYCEMSSYDTALIYHQKALEIAEDAKDNGQIASVYASLAYLYGEQDNYAVSLDWNLKALSIYESMGNKKRQSRILGNVGGMYSLLGNTTQAILYMEQAKAIAEELDLLPEQMLAFYTLGGIYTEKGDLDKAIEYESKAIELSRITGHTRTEVFAMQALAMMYCDYFQDYDKALKYADTCLRVGEKSGNPAQFSGTWIVLSNIYLSQERYKEAEAAAFKAWEMDSVGMASEPNILSNIALCNIFLGNRDKAIAFYLKYKDAKNKYTDVSFQAKLVEMEVKYETEKKEIRIATLERERKLYAWIVIISIIAALSSFGVLYFLHRLNRQKLKQLEQEKQLVATKAVIDGEASERSRLARDLHDGLSGMLSAVKLNLKLMKGFSLLDAADVAHFNTALEMLDGSMGELRRIAHNLMPDALIKSGLQTALDDFCRVVPGASFRFFGDDSGLDIHFKIQIYRCAYELVNNAIKHAQASAINVQLIIDSSLVSLSVQDDGVGFDPDRVAGGAGIENIRARVATCNGKMQIYSSPGNGTETNIEIEL